MAFDFTFLTCAGTQLHLKNYIQLSCF